MSVNKVILLGNVGRDPEVRYPSQGQIVATFPLATSDRGYTTSSGVQVPERTEWHNLVMWGRNAEVAEKYVRKGSRLYVEGRLRTRNYEDRNKMGYSFQLDKFRNKVLISQLRASTIQYDTLSETPYHWILRNYTIRDFGGMREVITQGTQTDSIIKMEPSDFLITKGQQETMTSPDLREYIEKQKQRGFADIKAFEVEYYKRGASSFAAFILTAIGLSLSAKRRKNGMGIALGTGLTLTFAYILFQTISASFAINSNVPPILAVWIPNIVYIIIAFFFYRKAPK